MYTYIYLYRTIQARAIMATDPPFPVLHINAAWTELSGISQVIPLQLLLLLPLLHIYITSYTIQYIMYLHTVLYYNACNHIQYTNTYYTIYYTM